MNAAPVPAPAPVDPRTRLVGELLDVVSDERIGLDAVLGRVAALVSRACGEPVEARVDRPAPAGEEDGLVLPLRLFGEDLGRLVLAGVQPGELCAEATRTLAHVTAVAVKASANRRERDLDAAVAQAVRRLFEEGTRAASVRAAGEVLARVTAEVMGAERVAVHLTDAEGRVHDVLDVGVPADVARALRDMVVGRRASDSPVWQQARREGGPVLADDAGAHPGRPGGFVETMRLRSYVAMPLMSSAGTVGMVVCGDVRGTRVWTERERRVAQQLAMQGALVVDSARLRQAEQAHLEDLRHRADHDPLTGLANRRRLQREVAAVLPARRGALLLLDLDGFKQVNDGFGHHVGDELLCEVARRLRQEVRAGDLAARLGGDEFAVLLPHATPEQAAALARRLDDAVRRPVVLEDAVVSVGVSVGVAPLVAPGCEAAGVAGVLRRADAAMYAVKRRGRRGA
ncbi:diguanylate cyclase domain-containing protein [Kineococcus sp. SYSU DK001]|uniref:diguanylate cyclase domain-containing protein n=1 Tax=Kineococcus sp. SYSU DK001 TaxID=3383122 RepID=UPI003D7E0CFC